MPHGSLIGQGQGWQVSGLRLMGINVKQSLRELTKQPDPVVVNR
jgi:hypothetical protein